MSEPEYPEHEKLKAISDKSQAIGDFLMWTRATLCHSHTHTDECDSDRRGHGRACGYYEGEMAPWNYGSIESLLAKYFEIDLNKLETEKRAMLDALRKANTP